MKGEKPLSTTERPIVVGVFKDEEKAKRAFDMLRDVGFSDDQVSIAVPGRGLMAHSILDGLVNMGMPEEEAKDHIREFEAGNSIVSVRHDGRKWEAINILYDGKVHMYLKRLKGQNEASQNFSVSNTSEKARSQAVEEATLDEMPPWMKLLKDAGFEHLI